MNNISNHFPQMGITPKQNELPEFFSASTTREQALSARESLSTNLVIETKEGDQVTLSANSYSRMDSYTYNSKGVIQTESGSAAFSENIREITLASGQSFSFSVEGDLNEAELQDIEEMLQGLDGVVAEMTGGDMDGAMEKALGLGQFDTFSSYAADISYRRSYQMTSTATATAQSLAPAESVEESNTPAAPETVEKGNRGMDVDKFFDKLLKQLDKHEDKLVGLAQNPMNKLFEHHLGEAENLEEGAEEISSAIEEAMDKLDSYLTEMMSDMFARELAAAQEEESA